MIHEMRLQSLPFMQIREGIKTVELRLFDEKRRRISVGDRIRFTSGDESLERRVIALHRHPSFAALLKTPLLAKCGFGECSPEAAAREMRAYYTEEEERMLGVLGIELA